MFKGAICGVTIRDRIRNEKIRRIVNVQTDPSRGGEGCVRWFGHVERTDGEEDI